MSGKKKSDKGKQSGKSTRKKVVRSDTTLKDEESGQEFSIKYYGPTESVKTLHERGIPVTINTQFAKKS